MERQDWRERSLEVDFAGRRGERFARSKPVQPHRSSRASVRYRELLARGAQLGLVIDEYRTDSRPGDFLIRGLAGADDRPAGWIARDIAKRLLERKGVF